MAKSSMAKSSMAKSGMAKSGKPRVSASPVASVAARPGPSNSLERALKVLDMIGQRSGGLSNKEISRELGIATSSCCYILSRLEREGYLERNPATGRYEIGLKVLAISRAVLRRMKFRKVAEPVLHKLSADSGLDGVIGVLDRNRLMVINRVSSAEFSRVDVDTGTEFPAHATAIGKVLLAHRPEEQVLNLIETKGLTRHTPKTITAAPDFLVELESVRKRGYAFSDEENTSGLRSIAAPIIDSEGTVRAAVALVGNTKHPIWRDTSAVVELVRTAAREISRLVRFH